MAPLTQNCTKCSKQYLVVDPEQQFLRGMNLPLPTMCPQCRQERRLALRGGRKLFRTKCQQCGKDIVVSYDPEKVTNKILCKEDYEKYFEQNDPIINEPLPDVNPATSQPTPAPAPPPEQVITQLDPQNQEQQ
ncbi:MAG: hypothetical protein HYW33_03065 [Candidatus Blackburnbacteria bacterium]|nr:hypothetical protein [Candidatus Blackburnbacteria bacterium]